MPDGYLAIPDCPLGTGRDLLSGVLLVTKTVAGMGIDVPLPLVLYAGTGNCLQIENETKPHENPNCKTF